MVGKHIASAHTGCSVAVKPTKPAGLVLADVRQTDKNKQNSTLLALALACLQTAHTAATVQLAYFLYLQHPQQMVCFMPLL